MHLRPGIKRRLPGTLGSLAWPAAALSPRASQGSAAAAAFTLVEAVIALFITSLFLAGILTLYVQAGTRSEWSAYSLSAEMMALSGLEQCRAAKYDPRGSPPTDLLVNSNFPVKVDILDVGTVNGAVTYGTNTTSITSVITNPPVKMIRVDCTWLFPKRGVFTNTVFTYRAANQ